MLLFLWLRFAVCRLDVGGSHLTRSVDLNMPVVSNMLLRKRKTFTVLTLNKISYKCTSLYFSSISRSEPMANHKWRPSPSQIAPLCMRQLESACIEKLKRYCQVELILGLRKFKDVHRQNGHSGKCKQKGI